MFYNQWVVMAPIKLGIFTKRLWLIKQTFDLSLFEVHSRSGFKTPSNPPEHVADCAC